MSFESIFGILFVPKRFSRCVEDHRTEFRQLCRKDLAEHQRKAVDRVGVHPRGGRQVAGDRKVSAVDQRTAVNQDNPAGIIKNGHILSFKRMYVSIGVIILKIMGWRSGFSSVVGSVLRFSGFYAHR